MEYHEKVEYIHKIANQVVSEIEHKFPKAFIQVMNYSFHIDNTNRRRGRKFAKNAALGYCSFTDNEIVLDIDHVQHCTLKQIENTIRHEYAHAVAYILHGDVKHGKDWKRVARRLNAEPKSSSVTTKEYKSAMGMNKKYVLVVWSNTGEHEVVGHYGRKLKRLRDQYLKDRKEQTLGRLKMLDNKLYQRGIIKVLHS